MRLLLAATALLTSPALAQTSGRLSNDARPILYDITIKADAKALTFVGSETVTVAVTKPVTTLTLNAAGLAVSSAMINGQPVTSFATDAKAQTLTVRFAKPIAPGEHKLSFAWTGKINKSATGLFAVDYKGTDGKDARMLVTQFEAPDARRFAPMWDEPSFKAKFRLTAFQPDGEMAFSNMPSTQSRKVDGGSMVSFAETPVMSSYLLFMGVGDVERKAKQFGKTEVGIITRRGVVDQGDYALDGAGKLLDYFNDYFGTPYPLPKLDMIAAPGSSQFFGAMENWGAILYFERRVLVDPKLTTEDQRQDVFATVAHEIAHQWFGNIVTMSWWDDLWLNEGFASWMEGKASADLNPEWNVHAQTVAGGRQGAMALDARSSTHPIIQKIATVDQISQAFDTITYQKGEAVIGMLEADLGEVPFREGVRNYMRKYAYKNTLTDQLWAELAASSGKPVKTIMDGFTKQGGVPLIRVGTPVCSNGKSSMTLSQSRFGLDQPSKAARSWIVPVKVGLANGAAQRVEVAGAKPKSVTIPGCGLAIVNKGQSGYFRTLYAPGHLIALRDNFATLSVEDQLGLISDQYALANGDYIGIDRHLDLIGAVPQSASPFVWKQVAGQLSGLLDRLRDTPNEAAFKARAARLLAPIARAVGWEPKAGEAPAMAQLRGALIPAMAQFGHAETVAEAARYLEASFANPDSVSSSIRLAALAAYAQNMDAAGWEKLRARAKADPSPVAQSIYYRSLGAAGDKALAHKTLALALTDEASVPIRSGLIASVAGRHPDLAFDWAVANKDKVNALLEESSRSEFIVGLGAGSSDLATARKVAAYAAANLPVASRAPAREAVTLIQYRADRRAKQSPALAAWANAK
jgi:aminopeptidase N